MPEDLKNYKAPDSFQILTGEEVGLVLIGIFALLLLVDLLHKFGVL